MRPIRLRFGAGTLTAVAVLAAAILVTAGLSAAQTPAPAGARLHWAMAVSSLENVSQVDAGLAEANFDTPDTFVQNSSPLTRRPSPPGWDSTSTDRWASFRQFAADVRDGAVPSYVSAVHYDNENWSQTPADEQLRPGHYERRFCNLAHANGWLCYTGPGQDLCGALDHRAGETYAQCYLALDLAGKAARYADMIDIQAQALEPRGARTYGSFIRRAAAQARAANPDVTILGNIAPSPSGAAVSAARMFACARAALPYVDGFYTTVTDANGATMVSFLRLLDG